MLNQIRTPGPADIFISWTKQWPEAPFVRYLSMLNAETLMVNNLEAFKEVQQTKAFSFRKSQLAARMFSPITGHGLMFSEGEERKKQRTQLNREFLYFKLPLAFCAFLLLTLLRRGVLKPKHSYDAASLPAQGQPDV